MKRTYQPSNRRRKRTHGFLARMASPGGRRILKQRRTKGRHRLTVSIPPKQPRVERRPGAGFGAEYRLRRRSDFLRVRRAGLRFQSQHFVIYLAMLPDQTIARLGLAVSRQVGNAVVRNRIKRRLRESFRCCLRPALGPGSSVMIVARKGADGLRTPEVTAELKPVLLRMAKKFEATCSQAR